MPERQDRGLIRDPFGEQGNTGKAAHRRHLNQRILHRRIAQVVPLLQQMNPQHRLKWISKPATLPAGLGSWSWGSGVQSDRPVLSKAQPAPSRLESARVGGASGRGLLVIANSELLAAHESCPHLGSQAIFRAGWRGVPESPQHPSASLPRAFEISLGAIVLARSCRGQW